jgi:hypothetical protein
MKLKIDWKALGKALWNAVKPVLLGAIGVPGIVIITKSTQHEDASGGDTNAPTQTNPVTTTMSTGK